MMELGCWRVIEVGCVWGSGRNGGWGRQGDGGLEVGCEKVMVAAVGKTTG